MAVVQIPYNKIIKTEGDWQLVSPSLDKNDCCYLDFSGPLNTVVGVLAAVLRK